MNKEISKIQKKYCSLAMIIVITVALVLILIGETPAGKGLVLGTLFSIFNFIIMGHLVSFKLTGSRAKASVFAFVSILLRFGLMALPLIFSMLSEAVHFAGVAIGLFMIQLTILLDQVIRDRLISKTIDRLKPWMN
ncbi:MAG: ATP synthase subunit I [Deltaproteobacteria bacterium]|nr:ATP synthase subunit I [Deltaproteobacteria bacterium]